MTDRYPDIDRYMPLFLEESESYIDAMNAALLRLERSPEQGPELIEELFRSAHSLKGMSAMMGLDGIAGVTHELENALAAHRADDRRFDPREVDLIFEVVDALGNAVASLASPDAEPDAQELDHLLERLRPTAVAAASHVPAGAERNAGEEADPPLAASRRPGAWHAEVVLSPTTDVPAARALIVRRQLAELGELLDIRGDGADATADRPIEAWFVPSVPGHELEQRLQRIPDVHRVVLRQVQQSQPAVTAAAEPAGASRRSPSVRVDAQRLDELMYAMQELIVARGQLERQLEALPPDERRREAVERLSGKAAALQQQVMGIRMTPVGLAFSRVPRLVRDLASRLDKQVDLHLHGTETEVDRGVIDALADPLVHVIRNAIDHGIEPPHERRAAGKPECANLRVAAHPSAGQVVISVEDDGRGIDPDLVARQARARGLLDDAGQRRVDGDMALAIELLFHPGMSTADQATEISGRGVGMGSVRATARELGGDVVVTSTPGSGTVVQVLLPLTLAIMPALLVRVGDMTGAIPLDRIQWVEQVDAARCAPVGGSRMLESRGRLLPIHELGALMGEATPASDVRFAVVSRVRDELIALGVQEVHGSTDLVTRPLPAVVSSQIPVTGAGLLPDGNVALIVDCDAVARLEGALRSAR